MSIILIGMSGSGKTTIGKELEKRTSYKLIDTDDMIKKIEGIEIEDIFKTKGEKYFRDLETATLKKIKNKKNLIVATGGGIILRTENVKILKNIGKIYLLNSSIDNLIKNLQTSKEVRPLLEGEEELSKKLKNMYQNRKELYEKSCDNKIGVDKKTVEEIADEILSIHKC